MTALPNDKIKAVGVPATSVLSLRSQLLILLLLFPNPPVVVPKRIAPPVAVSVGSELLPDSTVQYLMVLKVASFISEIVGNCVVFKKRRNFPLPPNLPSMVTLSAPLKRIIVLATVPVILRTTAALGCMVKV